METYLGLPLYYLDVDDTVEGVSIVSIVDFPAVESDFLKFSKDDKEEPMKFSYDDERHIITGVALIPEKRIYRRSYSDGYEYYVTFTKEAIERIVEKFFRDFKATNVNLEHSEMTEACVIFESYLLDKERNIAPKEFADMPDGTWLISMKVNDRALWDDIKAGKYNGFSVEGLLRIEEEPAPEIKEFDNLEDLLDYLKDN